MTVHPMRPVAISIDRPYAEVVAYLFDRARYGEWAEGLGASWRMLDALTGVSATPQGEARVSFVAENAFGVLDHEVALPDGQTFSSPMRVTRNGDGADVCFLVIASEGVDLDADAEAVRRDLEKLKSLLESGV